MSAQDLRLRLTIRRHGLPEVKLVWPCVASADLTISKLLAEINEVVPLEGEQWGLEDYAVELTDEKGATFECLHFQQVGRTLKQDDQVIIRSLSTDDLKRRRLSGRHQISADGKHLVDGIAFGRPWLKTPRDRPALALPPRKRAKITYDSEDDDTDEDAPQQLLLGAPESIDDLGPGSVGVEAQFLDADGLVDDEDADDDFSPDEDPNEEDDADLEAADLAKELELLKQDNDIVGEEEPAGVEPDGAVETTSRIDLDHLDHITILRSAFPLTPIATIMAEAIRHKDLERAHNALSRLNDPALSYGQMMEASAGPQPATLPEPESESDEELPGLLPEAPTAKRPLIQEVEEPEAEQLEDAESDSEDSEDSEESEEETSDESSDSDSDDPGDSDADTSDDDATGAAPATDPFAPAEDGSTSESSESESDDSSSDDDGGGAPAIRTHAVVADSSDSDSESSESESDSSEDSDSESEPEVATSKPTIQKSVVKAQSVSVPEAAQGQTETEPRNVETSAQEPVPPGQGMTKTKLRNARRRAAKAAKRAEQQAKTNPADAEFVARREALLKSIDISEVPEPSVLEQEASKQQAPPKASPQQQAADYELTGTSGAPALQQPVSELPQPARRSRLDLGSGRRLLFGALGLRTPKNKADEEKLKEKLMNSVRPLPNARITEVEQETEQPGEVEDPNWKDKITYRAVECCRDMVLSEPPFPFVQRWDPQQQYGSMHKRKRKSQNYDETSFYDDSQVQDTTPNKRSRIIEAQSAADGEVQLNYDEPPANAEPEDLPPLPSDITTLPSLQPAEIKTGMVITWKQLQLSKATNWQPQLSSVTGLVVPSEEDVLHVVLAKRDRIRDDKTYDENGQRVYDRFEAPDSDEEAEDDGRRNVDWDELTDLRLVQREPSPSQDTQAKVSEIQDTPSFTIGEPNPQAQPDLLVRASRDSERQDSNESASIQSGQAVPRPDLESREDPPMTMSAGSAGEGANSPTRQLQETSQAAMEVEHVETTATDDAVELGSVRVESVAVEAAASSPFFDSATDIVRSGKAAESPGYEVTVPTSPASISSGRQPQPEDEVEDGAMDSVESVVPETLLDPVPRGSPEADASEPVDYDGLPSSSPLPSLEQIYHTASTSRQAQTPRSAGRIPQPKFKPDADYEEAMRRLDNGEENNEEDSDGSAKLKSLFPNATQPPPPPSKESPDREAEELQTPIKSKRHMRARRSSPFVVPPGSQVVTIDSSPISAQITETYADDEIDETYQDEPRLPRGPGWVEKYIAPKSKRGRRTMPSSSMGGKQRRTTRSFV
ncbi:hypothetical protein S40293_00580 [Stachybotrys chartarum IBT 40293]|nr:hypothetical protein S40293_00580 [Stachybotrys chartarum IBT 40293]